MSLKSTQGPIDVFLCPEDSSGACSPVTGSSPAKSTDPCLLPEQPTGQSKASASAATLEESSSSPASTSSTVTAASQQDPSSLVMGSDSGECPDFTLEFLSKTVFSQSSATIKKKKRRSDRIQNWKRRDFSIKQVRKNKNLGNIYQLLCSPPAGRSVLAPS